MTDQNQNFRIRPYGDRWAILAGDEVVLVSESQERARAVVATADGVLERSGIGGPAERRSFARDED